MYTDLGFLPWDQTYSLLLRMWESRDDYGGLSMDLRVHFQPKWRAGRELHHGRLAPALAGWLAGWLDMLTNLLAGCWLCGPCRWLWLWCFRVPVELRPLRRHPGGVRRRAAAAVLLDWGGGRGGRQAVQGLLHAIQ